MNFKYTPLLLLHECAAWYKLPMLLLPLMHAYIRLHKKWCLFYMFYVFITNSLCDSIFIKFIENMRNGREFSFSNVIVEWRAFLSTKILCKFIDSLHLQPSNVNVTRVKKDKSMKIIHMIHFEERNLCEIQSCWLRKMSVRVCFCLETK